VPALHSIPLPRAAATGKARSVITDVVETCRRNDESVGRRRTKTLSGFKVSHELQIACTVEQCRAAQTTADECSELVLDVLRYSQPV